jgi:hypothetical protein
MPPGTYQLSAICAGVFPLSSPIFLIRSIRGSTCLMRESLNRGARGPNGFSPPALYLPATVKDSLETNDHALMLM